jgi:hypothetical protein
MCYMNIRTGTGNVFSQVLLPSLSWTASMDQYAHPHPQQMEEIETFQYFIWM